MLALGRRCVVLTLRRLEMSAGCDAPANFSDITTAAAPRSGESRSAT